MSRNRRNPARWLVAAAVAPTSIALFGASMVWTAHATPVIPGAPETTGTPDVTTTTVDTSKMSPAEAALAQQIAANDAKLQTLTQKLDSINAQTASITKQPVRKANGGTKTSGGSTKTGGSTSAGNGGGTTVTPPPPPTNTKTGGSGK